MFENAKVASNTALVAALRGIDAEVLQQALIAVIEEKGLTFGQREFFTPVQDRALALMMSKVLADVEKEHADANR